MVDSKIPWWCPTFEKDWLTLNSQLALDLSVWFDLSIGFIHWIYPFPLPTHTPPTSTSSQSSSSKTSSNKPLSSLLISSASVRQGLSWLRLSLLGSLHFSSEPKKAEEAHDQTPHFSVLLWHGSSEIPSLNRNPFAYSLKTPHTKQFPCQKLVRQVKLSVNPPKPQLQILQVLFPLQPDKS